MEASVSIQIPSIPVPSGLSGVEVGGMFSSFFFDEICLLCCQKDLGCGWKEMRCKKPLPSLKHLKMDGWNTIVSFWNGLFSGASC